MDTILPSAQSLSRRSSSRSASSCTRRAAPRRPIEKKLSPAGIRLLSLELIGELPRDLILSDNIKRTVETTATTNVSLNLNLSEIRIALQPGIHIDTPIGQAQLDALGLVFGKSYPRLVTKDVGSGLNIHGLIFKTLMEAIGAPFASVSLATALRFEVRSATVR